MNADNPPQAVSEVPERRCQNCGEVLLGEHCYACGQPTKGLVRHFSSIVGDFMDSVFELDSRILRTLGPLLLRPGYLSMEYFAGRRVRYVSPVRLFVFLSLFAFFAAQWSFSIQVDDAGTPASAVEEASSDNGGLSSATTTGGDATIRFGSERWDAQTNPIEVGWLPDAVNRKLNESTGRAQGNIARIQQDPNLIKDAFLSTVPATLFVLLPLFALLLRVVYVFNKRIYMEHLIVGLHSHAFLCASLLLVLLLDALAGWTSGIGWLSGGLALLEYALLAWMPIYLLLMQKKVYGQGWIMTLLKYFLLGTCYVFLLSFGASVNLMVSLVNL